MKSAVVDILSFTENKQKKALTKLTDHIHKIIESKGELKLFVYPSVSDVLASSILASKLIENDVLFSVHLTPTIKPESIDNFNVIVLGIPLIAKQYRELSSKINQGVILGLCIEDLSRSRGNLGILCSKKYVSSAVYVWQLLKDSYDHLDYMLTLAAIFASNMFKYPKDNLEKTVFKESINKELIEEVKGLRIYGVNEKPLFKALSDSLIPYLYGLTGNDEQSKLFLKKHGITDLDSKLTDHEPAKIKEIIESILKIANKIDPNAWTVQELIGETYMFKKNMHLIPSDVAEFAVLLDTIVETLRLDKAVFLKEFFNITVQFKTSSYYETIKRVDKFMRTIITEGARELDIDGRKLKIIESPKKFEIPYHIAESLFLTTGLIDASDIVVYEEDNNYLLLFSTIKRVFQTKTPVVMRKLYLKSKGEIMEGIMFQTLRNLISSLRGT